MIIMTHPVRLVYSDDGKRLEFDNDGMQFFENIKTPIVVVSVCGFLLNQLLGRTDGFPLFQNSQQCTRGIWLWNSLIDEADDKGVRRKLLLLDCQGLDTLPLKEQYLYICILLSKMLIFNKVGRLNLDAMNSLEECLKPIGDPTDEVRGHIRDLFRHKYFFTLVRPSTDEDELLDLGNMSMEQLRQPFIEGVTNLRRFIINQMEPKLIGGTCTDGRFIASLTRSYIDAFNKGKRASINTMWERHTDMCARNAYDVAVKSYNPCFKSLLNQICLAHGETRKFLQNHAPGAGPIRKEDNKTEEARCYEEKASTPPSDTPCFLTSLLSFVSPNQTGLLLDRYVGRHLEFGELYRRRLPAVVVKHQLYPEQMDMKFWDLLSGSLEEGWLHESHMTLWIRLLMQNSQNTDRWTIMPIIFFDGRPGNDFRQYASGNIGLPDIARAWWTVDTVYIPINIPNAHWLLGRLQLNTMTLYVYDSSSGFSQLHSNGKFENFRKQIALLLDQIKYWDRMGIPRQTTLNMQFEEVDGVPKQASGLGDCGVFVCKFMEQLISGHQVTMFEKAAEAVMLFRARMTCIFWASRTPDCS